MTVIGVYMPYYDGTANQTVLYTQTLEDVQCVIDCNDPSPVLFVGDMNAAMPRAEQLSRKWYKLRPFNRHSMLLYDFVCQNDLYSCNFEFAQKVEYTYHKNSNFTYIDHVFFSQYAHNKIINCIYYMISQILLVTIYHYKRPLLLT